jgi:hypothetical protein
MVVPAHAQGPDRGGVRSDEDAELQRARAVGGVSPDAAANETPIVDRRCILAPLLGGWTSSRSTGAFRIGGRR